MCCTSVPDHNPPSAAELAELNNVVSMEQSHMKSRLVRKQNFCPFSGIEETMPSTSRYSRNTVTSK